MALIRGNAAFVWTDSNDLVTERVLLVAEPVREIRAAHRQSVYVADTLDFTSRQYFTIGTGVNETVVRVRYGFDPQGLIDLIKAGSRGNQLTYYPDMNVPGRAHKYYLIAPLSPIQLAMDRDMGVTFGYQEVELTLRETN